MREAASFFASRSSAAAGVGLAHTALHFVERTLRAWRDRKSIASLADMDDHVLADLGVTRDDVTRALRLPFSHDVGAELERAAWRNRRHGWNI